MKVLPYVVLAVLLPSIACAAPHSVNLLKELTDAPSAKSLGTSPYHLAPEIAPDKQVRPVSEWVEQLDSEMDVSLINEKLPESDIPLTLNSKVNYFIDFFQGRGRGFFAKWLSRSERYIPTMKEILRKEGMPEDLVYLAMIESGFTPHAVSVANAVGPWQFISGTGKRYDLRIDSWIDERRDPIKSTVAAALYLKQLYAMFNNDWYLAAAGYNAGENKILRAISMYDTRDFWQISKGSYLKRETKDYVPKLLAAAIIAKEPAKYGFADVAYLPSLELDTVEIPTRTDLDLIARITDVPLQAIKDLNPELRRWCTPPDYPGYLLKLPKGKKDIFVAEYAKIAEDDRYSERIVYGKYRAKKHDTLKSVASRFHTTTEQIAELNNIGAKTKIKGKTLTVPMQSAALKPAHKAKGVESVESVASAEKHENRYYTVKKGDTLFSLAKKFKVTTTLLAAWNDIAEKVSLKPGKRIIVAKNTSKENG